MSKWETYEPYNSLTQTLQASARYEHERNDALDLLEKMLCHCSFYREQMDVPLTIAEGEAKKLLDRLRLPAAGVEERCPNCSQEQGGACIAVTDVQRPYCSQCGRKLYKPPKQPTVREKVDRMEEMCRKGTGGLVTERIRLLADELDALKGAT